MATQRYLIALGANTSFVVCYLSLQAIRGLNTMGKYIEGIAKDSNLKQWQDYAAKNSYSRDKAQTKRDLNPQVATTAADYGRGLKK
jgi:hypothetical protein